MLDNIPHVFPVNFEIVPNFHNIVESHEDEFIVVEIIPFQIPWIAFVAEVFPVPADDCPPEHHTV